jgi:hypothetical protein
MKKILFLISLLSILPLFSFGQNMHISGNVFDTIGNVPLENAMAMVVRIKDSLLIDFKRSDRAGNFEFNTLPLDTLQLIVSHPKFGEREFYFFGRADNANFELKKIILPVRSTRIDEVTIYAFKDPIFYKGDTLVYVADSFATKPNAVVEDLLKKLPGIKVAADGSITSQGKEISQVLVDGDEFFGADPTMATKNLAAKGVESVQVYEKKNENGSEGDETIQVLDLKLKDDAKKGYFGKTSAAGDFKRFYEGELLANKFNKKQKISVFALASNTTNSSLRWQDAYKYGIETGFTYNEEEDQWQGDNIQQGSGFPTTLKTGVYYDDQITAKTKLAINYTYSNNGLKTAEKNKSQYFLEDTTYVTDQQNQSTSLSQSHALNMLVEHKIDSLTTIEFEPKLKINLANNNSDDKTDFVGSDNILNRSTTVKNNSESSGTNLKTRLTLIRDFKKKDRKLVATYRFTYDDNKSKGNLYSLNNNLFATIFNDTIDQAKDNNSLSLSHTASAIYTEPLNTKFKLEFDYEMFSNHNNQSKKTFNFMNGNYETADLNFSNEFESNKMQNRIGSSIIYDHKKNRFVGGVRFRNVTISNKNLISDTTILQSVNNFLPRFKYTHKFSQTNRFVANYSTSSSQPTVSQLQPVRDNTNPNRISLGNPNLKPNYVHSAFISYNSYKPVSGRYIWSRLSQTITENAFTSSVDFDAFGRTYTKTVNTNGNAYTNLYFGGGFPVYKQIVTLNPNLNTGYSKFNNFVNGEKNITINKSIGGGLDVTYETDSLEFSLSGNISYTDPKSSISASSSQPFYTQNYNANLTVKLPWKFGIESDARYTINSGRAAGYDINYLIWNATVNKTFGKLENLILGVTVYDILNQNISAGRDINANVITDSQTTIIARYLLVKLTYKFNSAKIKENEESHF